MGVQVFWDAGMEELRQALRDLPEDLSRQAAGIVNGSADEMSQGLIANYPQGRTGNLRGGVSVTHGDGTTATTAKAVVRSRALIANIFEKGTKTRQTQQGWNRGQMPAPPESSRMIPRAIRARRRMTDQLIALVRAAGFEVSE